MAFPFYLHSLPLLDNINSGVSFIPSHPPITKQHKKLYKVRYTIRIFVVLLYCTVHYAASPSLTASRDVSLYHVQSLYTTCSLYTGYMYHMVSLYSTTCSLSIPNGASIQATCTTWFLSSMYHVRAVSLYHM